MKFKILVSIFALSALLFVGCDSTVYDEEKPEASEEIVVEEVVEEVSEPAPIIVPEPAVLAPEPEPIVHEASAAPMPVEESTEAPEITLAKCLTENGTKLYTATWCGHCQDQKAAFEEGLEYLDNTECAIEGETGWVAACTNAGIKGVPTWIFGDGTRQSGNTPLATLASLGGCTYQ